MTTDKNERRFFLKSAAIAAAALAISSAPSAEQAVAVPATSTHTIIPGSQFFDVSVASNLFDPPASLNIAPNVLSDPIKLKDRDPVRVKIVPGEIDPRYGQIYTVILTDAAGKQLTRMNLGNGATGTFGAFGIQVYIMSIQRAT